MASDGTSKEVDFIRAAELLEAQKEEPRLPMPTDFWDKLRRNKEAFKEATGQKATYATSTAQSSKGKLLKELKAMLSVREYTEEQTHYIKKVMARAGTLTEKAIKDAYRALKDDAQGGTFDPQKKYKLLREHISERLLMSHAHERADSTEERQEVILSAYLIK